MVNDSGKTQIPEPAELVLRTFASPSFPPIRGSVRWYMPFVSSV